MARPRRHTDEAMFAAVRELLLEGGPRAVTIAAVSERSGAPSGTIYHRFGSRADLVAELWIGAIKRLQTAVLDAGEAAVPATDRVLAMALATVDFCAANPDDARLLTLASRERLRRDDTLSERNRQALDDLNVPVLARLHELGEQCAAEGFELPDRHQRIVFAAVSIPYVAVRQALDTGAEIASMRPLVDGAARAVLTSGATR